VLPSFRTVTKHQTRKKHYNTLTTWREPHRSKVNPVDKTTLREY